MWSGARERDRPRPVVVALGWVILGCFTVAALLGLSKRGQPIWEPARAFFLPAGLLMMLQSTLLGGRRAHPMVAIPPNRLLAPSLFACGLGLAGIGAEHLDPARPWSVLTIPLWFVLGLLFLREAILGDDGMFMRLSPISGRLHRWVVRAGLWMFGLFWPLGVLWAVGLLGSS